MKEPKPESELMKLRRLLRENRALLEQLKVNPNLDLEQKKAQITVLQAESDALCVKLKTALQENAKNLPRQMMPQTREPFEDPDFF